MDFKFNMLETVRLYILNKLHIMLEGYKTRKFQNVRGWGYE